MRRPAALDSRVRSLEERGDALPRQMVATVSTDRIRLTVGSAPPLVARSRRGAGPRFAKADHSRMSAVPSIETLKTELLDDLARHSPKVDLLRAEEAFEYSAAAHGEQKRQSGVPYVSHPVATVHILVD